MALVIHRTSCRALLHRKISELIRMQERLRCAFAIIEESKIGWRRRNTQHLTTGDSRRFLRYNPS